MSLQIESKQNGVSVVTAGQLAKDITILSVVTAQSVVLIQVKANGVSQTNGSPGLFTAQITSSTNIYIERAVTGGWSCEIYWQVIEFSSDVSVQRGLDNLTTTANSTIISSVDLGESYSLTYARGQTLDTLMEESLVNDMLTTATTLLIYLDFPNVTNWAEWQVISISGATVQSFAGDSIGETYKDVIITSVTENESFLKVNLTKYSASGLNSNMMRGARLFDNVTVRLSGYTAGDINYKGYVIEHPDLSVQRGWETATAAITAIAISSVLTTDTFLSSGGHVQSWQTTNSTNNDYQEFSFVYRFDSQTQISVIKDEAVYTSTVSWEVIGATGTTPVTGGIPDYYFRMRTIHQ